MAQDRTQGKPGLKPNPLPLLENRTSVEERALRYNVSVHLTRRPRLGQHFLSDQGYRRRIVQSLPLQPDELVIEIGAGRGAMTPLLAERARRVIAIELDDGLAARLKENFKGDSRIEIVHADILSTDLAELCRRNETARCFVFGNLPYYITSPILNHLRTFRTWIRAMGLVVQREVAERLTARPGSPSYGFLSVLTQLYSEPRILLGIPAGAFSPLPKVESALVYFAMRPKFPAWAESTQGPDVGATHESPLQKGGEKKFLDFVKRCFAQKRKKLVNNLAAICPRRRVTHELEAMGLGPGLRAEQLTIEQFAGLYQRLFRSEIDALPST